MATTADIERIDASGGPGREDLIEAYEKRELIRKGVYPAVHFNGRFLRHGFDLRGTLAQRRSFHGDVVDLLALGEDPRSANLFLIRLAMNMGTFEGHYNTHTRKGSLHRVMDEDSFEPEPLTDFPFTAGELERKVMDMAYRHAQIVLRRLKGTGRPVHYAEFVRKIEAGGFDRAMGKDMFFRLGHSLNADLTIKFASDD